MTSFIILASILLENNIDTSFRQVFHSESDGVRVVVGLEPGEQGEGDFPLAGD